jgi:hypothetical protein
VNYDSHGLGLCAGLAFGLVCCTVPESGIGVCAARFALAVCLCCVCDESAIGNSRRWHLEHATYREASRPLTGYGTCQLSGFSSTVFSISRHKRRGILAASACIEKVK